MRASESSYVPALFSFTARREQRETNEPNMSYMSYLPFFVVNAAPANRKDCVFQAFFWCLMLEREGGSERGSSGQLCFG